MLNIDFKKSKDTHYMWVNAPLLKTENDVCCGLANLHASVLIYPEGSCFREYPDAVFYSLVVRVTDEDDLSLGKWAYFKTEEELIRAWHEAISFLNDYKYSKVDSMCDFAETVIQPFMDALSETSAWD